MKRFLYAGVCLLLIFGIAGCAAGKSGRKAASPAGKSVKSAPLPPYSGPKAEVALADFDLKVALATEEIGAGLRAMLAAALINSNRFLVAERKAPQSAKKQEEPAVAENAGALPEPEKKEEVKPADLIISVAVTEFAPEVSGGRSGVGGGSSANSGVLGALLGGPVNKAHMALDIRIVNAATSEVLSQTQVRGQASGTSGSTAPDFFGANNLGAGLSDYADTPMEKAIRDCINEAVGQISRAVPSNYYKYGKTQT